MTCLAIMACKQVNVDFTYSPAAPRAGQTVTFSNLSSSGEEWNWTFGSGATSTLKSPTYVYRQPGTYKVTLQVDGKSSRSATKEITIYDTVPTFTCDAKEFTVYTDYTFKAVVYNPYNYDVSYEWAFPLNTPYVSFPDTSARLDGSSIKVHFTKAMEDAPIWLTVVLNGDTTHIEQSFNVQDRATNAVLFRTPQGDYRQRIFGTYAEMLLPASDDRSDSLLKTEQDTMQRYNNYVVSIDSLKSAFPGIQGFRIASRKIYYRANGLWVAHLDGSDRVQIDTATCKAMTLDTKDNRIYWANKEGVWYMPFVGSGNNQFVTIPVRLNTLKDVIKIAADAEKR